MPDAATLKAYYDRKAWFEGGERGGYVSYDEQTAQLLPLFERILDGFGVRGDGLSVLDVGCGYGSHLAIAHERGWKCFGIEVSDHARRVIEERHGRSFFVVDDVEHLIPHEFDLIAMLDVLEHLPDPYRIFYALFAKGAITPKTKIVIATPNARSTDAMADPAGWVFRHPPSHLVFFSAESLTRLLRTLRFNSIDVRGLFESSTEREPPSYGDERLPLNEKLVGFAGLLCEASGSDFAEFMRERYVPGTWSRLAEYEHLPRYLFARNLARGMRVLDFGCGTGYGTAILAQAADSVVGVDIDASALDWARSHHSASNVSFDLRDDLGAGLAADSFDLIACFEMIEHVPEEIQVKTIKSFMRLLQDDGIAIISTPNPDVTKLYGPNPYHIREMTEAEFGALLREYFPHVRMLYQWVKPAVLISSSSTEGLHRPTDRLSWRDVPDAGDSPAVFLALCSKSPLPEVEGRCYLDFAADYIGEQLEWSARVNRLSLDHYLANEEASSLRGQLEITAREMNAEIERRGTAFDEQEQNIAALRVTITAGETALAEQQGHVVMLQTRLAAGETALAEQQSHAAVLQTRLAAATESVRALSERMRDRYATIERVRAACAALEQKTAVLEQNLEHLGGVLLERESTLHAVLSSRWMQLGNALNERPVTVASIKRSLYLAVSIVVPAPLKRALRLLLRRSRVTTETTSRTPEFEPCVVKVPASSVPEPVPAPEVDELEPCGVKVPAPSGPEPVPAPEVDEFQPYVVKLPASARRQRPRILHVIANFMTGGSSQLVVDLIERLGHEYDQYVLTSHKPHPECYVNVPIIELKQGTSVDEIATFILYFAPDLLHVHYWGDCDEPWYHAVFRAADVAGVRVIENVNTPVKPYRTDRIERYVFVSDYVERTFGTGLESQSLRIYPGSDFQIFDREIHATAADDCVGMVYRLETDKLNESSIDPFIKTVQRRPGTRALIVGGGSLLDSFRRSVEATGFDAAFTFTGYVPYRQLPALYARMSVFVAPVWKESFGQVSSFAMSMGIPVVGYEVGALPEIIGDPNLCVTGGDSDRLADIIVELLDNRAHRLEIGRHNRQRAHAQFSVDATIDAYRRLYAALLEGRR